LKQSFILFIFGIVQLISGFFVNILIIRIYGVSLETDSYLTGQIIPNIILGIFVPALNGVWLPKLSSESNDLGKWKNVLSKSLGQAVILYVILSICLSIFLYYFIHLFFPGFSSIQLESVFCYTSINFCSIFFVLLSSQMVNALRTVNKFYIVEIISLAGAVLILPLLYIYGLRFSLIIFSLIMLVRNAIVFLFQMHFADWPKILILEGFRDKESWKLMKPVLFGSSIYKLAPLFDRFLLSFAPIGTITIYSLSFTFVNAGSQILEKSLVMPFVVKVGRLVESNNFKEIRSNIFKIIFQVTLLAIILVFFSISFRDVILSYFVILFKLTDSGAESLLLYSSLMAGYFCAVVLGALPVSVFYALKDSRTPLMIGVIGFFIGILLKLTGFFLFGIEGFILALSIYYVINLFLLLTSLKKNKKYVCNT
jgi:putative peptidoglycan lipid II flippase